MRKSKIGKVVSILIIICMVIMFGEEGSYNASNVSVAEMDEVSTGVTCLLSDCVVEAQSVGGSESENVLSFTLSNTGEMDVSDWSIVFEANYSILSSDDVMVFENAQIKHIDCQEDNGYISAGESVTFEIRIEGASISNIDNNYRVYGKYIVDGRYDDVSYVERLNENVDVIKYEAETGEYTLNINNSAEIMRAYEEELSIEADDFYIDATDFGGNQAETYKIIGDSDTRTRVTNVTSSPYYAIAFLLVTNQNGTITSGTGFMINDSCMATAAHVVDGAQKVEVYFGVDGIDYEYKYIADSWAYCASYPTSNSTADDWAVIEFTQNVASRTGHFLVGYTSYDYQLHTMNFTVCGFPGDKKVPNSNGICGNERYMYKDSSAIYSYSNEVLSYVADTWSGQSGSPIYNSQTYTVYGIHCVGGTTCNSGKRFTPALYTTFRENGWID